MDGYILQLVPLSLSVLLFFVFEGWGMEKGGRGVIEQVPV